MGEIILAIKYDTHIDTVRESIDSLGGLETVARERPWIFDYTAADPLPGYEK